jgi:hypothetical protein
MMRIVPIVLVSLLAACAGHDGSQVGNGLPGLDIARAALSGGSPDIALNVTNAILAKEPGNAPALVSRRPGVGRCSDRTGALAAELRSGTGTIAFLEGAATRTEQHGGAE